MTGSTGTRQPPGRPGHGARRSARDRSGPGGTRASRRRRSRTTWPRTRRASESGAGVPLPRPPAARPRDTPSRWASLLTHMSMRPLTLWVVAALVFATGTLVRGAQRRRVDDRVSRRNDAARHHSARIASTGLRRLARRAGMTHASSAATPRHASVAVSRSGLLADV